MPPADEDGAALELQYFERVDATPGTILLRVTARASGVTTNRLPELIVDDGSRVHRLAALPAPADSSGLLRAAYPTPSSLVDRGEVAFALELAEGVIVELPAPTTRPRRDELQAALEAAQVELDRYASELEKARALSTESARRATELEAERDEASRQQPLSAVATLGICLLVFGLSFAVLILTGALKVG